MKKIVWLNVALLALSQSAFSQNAPTSLDAVGPRDVLPDGIDASGVINPFTGEKGFARKGSIFSFYKNIASLDQLLVLPSSEEVHKKIKNITSAIQGNMTALKALGLFDLFSPTEWLASTEHPGRVFAALQYLKSYPHLLTQEIRADLASRQSRGDLPKYTQKEVSHLLQK